MEIKDKKPPVAPAQTPMTILLGRDMQTPKKALPSGGGWADYGG